MGLEKVYFRVAGIVGFSGSLTLVLINWLEVGVADAWLWMVQGLAVLACAAVVVKTFMSSTVSATQSTDRLHLFDSMNQLAAPVVVADPEGIVVFFNNAAEKVFDVDLNEARGKDFVADFIVRNAQSKFEELMLQAIAEERDTYSQEIPVYVDGKYIDLIVSTSLLRGEGGEVEGVVAVGQEVTDLLKSRDLDSEGENKEVLGNIAAGIAHDFSNLLNIIDGNLKFIADGFDPNDLHVQEAFEDSTSAIADGVDLTKKLVLMSKGEGQSRDEADITSTLIKVERYARRMAQGNAAIEFQIMHGDASANIDVVLFESCVINLIKNSVEAVGTDGRIVVTSEVLEEEGLGVLQVSVKDNGCGIPRDKLNAVKKAFYTSKATGSGLGLAMAERFCRQAAGKLLIDSDIGEGTTVTIRIPLPENAEPLREETVLLGKEVLLVEDDDRVGRLVERDLKSMDYRVTRAHDSDEALKILHSDQKFDLVLTDVMMPGELDGFELAKWIEKNREIPVVVMSAYAGPHEQKSDFPFLRKPYSFEGLSEVLQKLA